MSVTTIERPPGARPLRRDAQVRRDALLQAAAECFAEQGYHVALEEIADRAGVGRGTLYRNFKDRMALVYAIFEREVEQLDLSVDPHEPLAVTLTRLALEGTRAHALFARLAGDMPLHGENLIAFEALGKRFATLIEPAALTAQRRGELRPDVGGHQLALALRMIGGLLNLHMDETQMRVAISEAIDLLLKGMAPSFSIGMSEAALGKRRRKGRVASR